MPEKKRRAALRRQQAAEVEESQRALRESIAHTETLVSKSDEMLERHRRERDDDETDG